MFRVWRQSLKTLEVCQYSFFGEFRRGEITHTPCVQIKIGRWVHFPLTVTSAEQGARLIFRGAAGWRKGAVSAYMVYLELVAPIDYGLLMIDYWKTCASDAAKLGKEQNCAPDFAGGSVRDGVDLCEAGKD